MALIEGGQQIGPYTIKSELGHGEMATVYLAYDPGLEREVALKVVRPHLAENADFMARFLREARIAARLRHAHIVLIYSIDNSAQPRYLAMEYMRGGTLRELIQAERPLSVDRSIDLLSQVAEALDYAHREPHSIVHRDVKPANILLDESGQLHLADFGIARAWDSVNITIEGQVLGTLAYMAPEQAEGLPNVDGRADLYALGVIAFEMLTGRVPFEGTNSAVLNQQINKAPPSLRELRQTVPAHVEAAVLRMLAKSPDQRFQTGADFINALRGNSAPTVLDPAVTTDGPAQHTKPKPADAGTASGGRRPWPRTVAVSAAVVVAAMAVLWLLLQVSSPKGPTPSPTVAPTHPRRVLTLAGTASQSGFADGAGAAARFSNPVAVAVDRSGNVYVAEEMNHRIRKISPNGNVTTIGGPTTAVANPSGLANGPGASARFHTPLDLRLDQAGVVYVADSGNNAIRTLTPASNGTYTVNTINVKGLALNSPSGIAVNSDASAIYITDDPSRVLELRRTAPGEYTATAVAPSGGFKQPASVALDDGGAVYVADTGNNRLVQLTRGSASAGWTMAVLQTGLMEPGTLDVTRPSFTTGAADRGAVYLGNGGKGKPQVIELVPRPAGGYDQRVVAGSTPGFADGDLANPAQVRFAWATGVALDPSGALYIADKPNQVIRKLTQ